MPLSTTTNTQSIISLVSKKSFFETIMKLKTAPCLGNMASMYRDLSQEELITALSQLSTNQAHFVISLAEKPHNAFVYLPEISLQQIRNSKKQFFVVEQTPYTQKLIENFINYSDAPFYMSGTISNFLEQNFERTFQFFELMPQNVFNEFIINIDSILESSIQDEMPLFNEYIQNQFHIIDATHNSDYTPFFVLFAIYLILLKTQ